MAESLPPPVEQPKRRGRPPKVKSDPEAEAATQALADAAADASIFGMKFIAAINFNRTENNTLYRDRDRCSFTAGPLGITATGDKFHETVLIPWANIVYVKYS